MSAKTSATGSSLLVDILKTGDDFLTSRNIESSRLEAEWLLADLLELSRLDLYLRFDRPLSTQEKEKYGKRLRRRAGGEPLQYILGYTEFYGHRFKVKPGVLIPRPETETLIEVVKEIAPEGGFANVLDVGCGTGIIGIVLLKEGLAQKVFAVDINPRAVELTMENAADLGLDDKTIIVRKADIFGDKYKPSGKMKLDLVVSNPPYVRDDEWENLAVEITGYEPRNALTSGEDGLRAHRSLAKLLPKWLGESGIFVGEIGDEQGSEAVKIHSQWANEVTLHKDLNGRDRVVKGHSR